MNILFRSKKLEKVCNDKRLSTQEYGAEIAKKLHQRLNELRASETLANFCRLPAPAAMHSRIIAPESLLQT